MAGDGVTIKFGGGLEIQAALAHMEQKTQRSIVTKAVRKSVTPLRNKVRNEIAAGLTTMNAAARAQYAKQIGISTATVRSGGVIGKLRTANKKVTLASGRTVNFQPLAHIFEGGAKAHLIKQKKRTIQHPGIRGIAVWSDTFSESAQEMTDILKAELIDRIAAEWNRGK